MDFPDLKNLKTKKQAISYLGANWWVVHVNWKPDLSAV